MENSFHFAHRNSGSHSHFINPVTSAPGTTPSLQVNGRFYRNCVYFLRRLLISYATPGFGGRSAKEMEAGRCPGELVSLPVCLRDRIFNYRLAAAVLAVITIPLALAQENVLTGSYDNARTNANLNEAILVPARSGPMFSESCFRFRSTGRFTRSRSISSMSISRQGHP